MLDSERVTAPLSLTERAPASRSCCCTAWAPPAATSPLSSPR